MGNLWFFSGILSLVMSKDPVSDALQRTTTAPTIFEAGFKDNGAQDNQDSTLTSYFIFVLFQ